MLVTPFLMFEGQAEAAMRFYAYAALFPDAEIGEIERFGPGGPGAEGTVLRASMSLAGQAVRFFDSPAKHAFGFTPAFSLFVDCDGEDQIRALAAALGEGGSALMPLGDYGFSRLFVWLNDRFGVSWQLNLA
jgi:predicted 3-demethylubiquinone-9 3-methyltransferase (glyoxalase superfamily)